jgi:hypothetical protein
MEVSGIGRNRPGARRETLLTLKSRAFPGRVRAILDTLLSQLSPYLEHGMVAALDAFEQALFRRAEQARNNEEQQRCFESLREVRRVRADLAPALVALFESALASLNEPRRHSTLAKPQQRSLRGELSLVDSSELEESLVLVEAANRAEVRSSQPLFALGMRFGTLAEGPLFEPEDLPIGPHRLGECVRIAAEHLNVPGEHRLLFFRAVDQALFSQLEKFIDEANRILVESRILAHLVVLNPRARRGDDVHPQQSPAHGGEHEPAPGTHGAAHHGPAEGGHGPAGTGHAHGGHGPGAADAGSGHGHFALGLGGASPAHAAPSHGHAAHPSPSSGQALHSTPSQGHAASTAPGPGYGGHPSPGQGAHPAPGSGQTAHAAPLGPSAHARADDAPGAASGSHAAVPAHGPTSLHGAAGNVPPTPSSAAQEASSRFQQRSLQTRFGLATPAATTVAEAETGDAGRFGGFSRPMTGWPGVPSPPAREEMAAPSPSAAANDVQDRQMFQTMRELLSGRRQALGLGAAPSPDPNAFSARSDDVQSVLGVLQQKPAMPLSVGGKLVPRSIGHVKQDILNQLRQVTPEGRIPRLHEEDADTIDLVGLLFENLAKHGQPNSTVSQLMTKLQIPLLRVALKDKSFFSKRSHPARQLLNAVAESGLYWLDEGEEDRPLVEKMQSVVDRVLHEFHEDPVVFEQVLSDLSRHLQTQARKSEVAERRHVDAARGREKLEQARHTATSAIAGKIGSHKPRALIRTLLEQAWTDVLALTVLRQGEESPIYRDRLDFVDKLIAFGRGEPAQAGAAQRDLLREALENGLSQIGFHVEDIQSVGDRLFGVQNAAGSSVAANDDPATLTEVAARLKAHSRFGEDGDHHPHHHAHKAHVDPPLNDAEQQVLVRLKALPFGTWFELAQPGQKDRVRRKLSWFSTLTGRCLFVNQRGARTHETSLEQLARDLHEQRARVYEEPQENLIDRAWHAIVRTLKTFTGQSGDAGSEVGSHA